jgi:DNA polymerase
MGAQKFQAQLKNFGVELELEETKRVIDTYRQTYPAIPQLWQESHSILGAIIGDQYAEFGRNGILKVEGRKGIRLPNGLYIKYPNLRFTETEQNGRLKTEYVYDARRGKQMVANRIYGGKVIENVCQALARIVIGMQMLMVAKKYRVVMTVHDAIGCIVPEAEAERAKEYVELCMRLRPEWAPELPLNCEAGYGDSYGAC